MCFALYFQQGRGGQGEPEEASSSAIPTLPAYRCLPTAQRGFPWLRREYVFIELLHITSGCQCCHCERKPKLELCCHTKCITFLTLYYCEKVSRKWREKHHATGSAFTCPDPPNTMRFSRKFRESGGAINSTWARKWKFVSLHWLCTYFTYWIRVWCEHSIKGDPRQSIIFEDVYAHNYQNNFLIFFTNLF